MDKIALIEDNNIEVLQEKVNSMLRHYSAKLISIQIKRFQNQMTAEWFYLAVVGYSEKK